MVALLPCRKITHASDRAAAVLGINQARPYGCCAPSTGLSSTCSNGSAGRRSPKARSFSKISAVSCVTSQIIAPA
jgi:hypothetical protein